MLPYIRLETTTIKVKIEGPEREVKRWVDDLQVYVPILLKPGDLPKEGDKKTAEVNYYFRDFKPRPFLQVTPMYDVKEANRRVTYTVLAEKKLEGFR